MKLTVFPPGLRARRCAREKVRASGRCVRRDGARETMMITDNQKEPGFTEAGEILFWKLYLTARGSVSMASVIATVSRLTVTTLASSLIISSL